MIGNAMDIDRKRSFVPDGMKGLFDRALITECGKSRADAVRLQCLECNGYSYAEAARCTERSCPLFHFNPYLKNSRPPSERGFMDVESSNGSFPAQSPGFKNNAQNCP
ncbi:MAG: hypothetical protein JXB18_11645 [Sedimentisphaerales bacterium]|nr:hypothetical protein [Sedimentisphaerales bacterium]